MYDLIGSIVIYRNPAKQIQKAMASFLNTGLNVRLYVIDNSPDDKTRELCKDERVVYIFTGETLALARDTT